MCPELGFFPRNLSTYLLKTYYLKDELGFFPQT